MANLAEDRHRVRVLRHREAAMHPAPLSESIAAAVGAMHKAGVRLLAGTDTTPWRQLRCDA